ncbi:hypothetical protein PF008_g28326 [Phytophthora fragariae]|uniref:Uncharacterized protein n=1 Tax=Phytophthora fragariae TaxID=53985 RepID=A0A6G0QBR3_9STRA|nr:hypothetical protein PF008_g28326 [Phytophthora fragariae]
MAIIPVAPTAPSPDQRIPSIEDQLLLVRESAQLMFHGEYIVLIEYVECVIPMVYGLYLQALFRLGGDARSYYPQTRGLSMDKLNSAVGNLVIYVWLEMASLLVLHLVIQRRLGSQSSISWRLCWRPTRCRCRGGCLSGRRSSSPSLWRTLVGTAFYDEGVVRCCI